MHFRKYVESHCHFAICIQITHISGPNNEFIYTENVISLKKKLLISLFLTMEDRGTFFAE